MDLMERQMMTEMGKVKEKAKVTELHDEERPH